MKACWLGLMTLPTTFLNLKARSLAKILWTLPARQICLSFIIVMEDTFEPCNLSNLSSSLGMGYLYLIVILFMALLSTHMRMLPSILRTKRAGTVHGLRDSHTSPFETSSSTCRWISSVSFGFIKLAGLLGSMVQGLNQYGAKSLLGGKPVGISSGKTWA